MDEAEVDFTENVMVSINDLEVDKSVVKGNLNDAVKVSIFFFLQFNLQCDYNVHSVHFVHNVFENLVKLYILVHSKKTYTQCISLTVHCTFFSHIL